jgi:hypothetical protein
MEFVCRQQKLRAVFMSLDDGGQGENPAAPPCSASRMRVRDAETPPKKG